MVSVILPTFNRETLLAEAIASVLGQTCRDWELIVVDDGSTDGTRAALDELTDARIRPLLLDRCGNIARVRNAGAAAARGQWLAFLDSDDRWLPRKLELQVAAIEAHPRCGWSCTGVSYIDEHGRPTARRSQQSYTHHCGWILDKLLHYTAAATMSTLLVSTALFESVAGFDESFGSREDYDLALRLAERSEIHALPDALTELREHPGRTTTSTRRAELFRYNELAFRKAMARADSAAIRAICARQCAVQLALESGELSRQGDHRGAMAAIGKAFRERPFARFVWRAAGATIVRAALGGVLPS
jgi:glycosyltransferase involved in cell wall biosynthesis